ncbi:carotenoid 1,2-hydratase [Chitinimonas arctica]|uniref:Carotenoid 1,2-hydratase n=1 Tax=Chitinimonas arctica TaxID=2594795 RepID=A0A516SK00_9NEIS|nr:carotenoid 1,2-hydratase [Chitinimonas arctica]QDQ28482.1 carotenoid 1,2-hydratase [Chitinimonas arctica]
MALFPHRLGRLLCLVLALLLTPAWAGEFATVKPGAVLRFPADHGAHPSFRTEWWYLTGWLRLPDGKPAGFQLTFFRTATGLAADNPSGFAPKQLLFGHAALSDPANARMLHDQRLARGGLGLAQTASGNTDAAIGDWSLRRQSDDSYIATVAAKEFQYRLRLQPSQTILLQGDGGFSRKGPRPGQASYYYSRPHLKVDGVLTRQGRQITVSGEAWLDHEWSSQVLDDETVGWDWAGINLADGGSVTAFQLRDSKGRTRWTGGSRRYADGSVKILAPAEVSFTPRRHWTSPRSKIRYPTTMAIKLSGTVNEEWLLQPLLPDQELDARHSTGNMYWEGAVRAGKNGQQAGQGYLELTGYGQPLRM